MAVRTAARLAGAALAVLLVACGGEPEAPARHVVLVSLDALGARHVGAYGHEADTTPNLDAIAEQGTFFESAYTQQLWTLTSHLTMMTGLSPQAHGAGYDRPASKGVVTLAQHLKQRGFSTAAYVGAEGFMKPEYGLGRGFDVYAMRHADEPLDNRSAFSWLRAQAKLSREDPAHRFFLFLHYYDVHSDAGTVVPYDSPEPERFMPEGVAWKHPGDTAALGRLRRSGNVSEEDRIALHALYDASVHFVDAQAVGALARLLESEGLAGETLLVVTSDHGDELFEHGNISHQQPYDEGARVPLVLRGPRVPKGEHVSALAGLVDLMPTLMRLLGFEPPPGIEGLDLTPLLDGAALVRDAVFVDGIMTGYRNYRSAAIAIDAGWKYAWIGRVDAKPGTPLRTFGVVPPVELYDLGRDPQQQHDVSAEQPARAARLEERILAWYAENEVRAAELGAAGSGAAHEGQVLTEDERAQLRELGYAE